MRLSYYVKHMLKSLKHYGLENPLREIRYVLKEKLNLSYEEQIFNKDLVISVHEILELEKIFEERKKKKPLSKILNKSYFRDIILSVNEHTFSPRIDTEVLIDILIEQKINCKNILELGTGTGALSISLLKHYKSAKSIVTDISKEAIYIAKKNAIFNNTVHQMQFICCDWLSCFENLNFDIIISNPPYIKTSEIKNLNKNVKDHDPLISLDGGVDGLDCYRVIANQSTHLINEKGYILVEIGHDQAKGVEKIFGNNDFLLTNKVKDYNKLDRVLIFVKKKIKK